MQHKDLVDFIREKHLSGAAKRDIESILLGTGWDNNDIREAFEEYARTTAPSPRSGTIIPTPAGKTTLTFDEEPPSPATERPTPPTKTTTAPASQAKNKKNGESVASDQKLPEQSSEPLFAAESYKEKDLRSFVSGNHIYFLIVAAVSVLLFMGGVLGYYILYPKPENIILKSLAALSSVHSGGITNTFSLAVVESDAPDTNLISAQGTQRISFDMKNPGSTDLTQSLNMFYAAPVNGNTATATIAFGTSMRTTSAKTLMKFTDINIVLQSPENAGTKTTERVGDPIATAGETIKKIVQDKWLEAEPGDIRTAFAPKSEQTATTSLTVTKQSLDRIIDLVQKTNLFNLNKTKRDVLGGRDIYVISGDINKQGLKIFLMEAEDLSKTAALWSPNSIIGGTNNPPGEQDQSTRDKEKEIDALLDSIQSSSFKLLIGRDDFLPYRITVYSVINGQVLPSSLPFGILGPENRNTAPVSAHPKSNITIDLLFGDYDNATLSFEEPFNIKTFKEIIDSLSGAFVEKAKTKLNK